MNHTIQNIKYPTRLLDYCKVELASVLPSKNSIVKAIKRQELLLNEQSTTTGTHVQNGDIISLDKSTTVARHKLFELKMDVIFEDDHLAVIYKPAGYDVSGNKFKTIQNALLFNIEKSTDKDALAIPRPVHRIDNQTAGLLIIAKTQTAIIHPSKQFENRKTTKTYRCICMGTTPQEFTNYSSIGEQFATTEFTTIQHFENRFLGTLSLVEARPITGRKHQIRKHLSKISFPILGDKLYGKHYTKGLFLFAKTIEFIHPNSGKRMFFELNLPSKFNTILRH